MEGWSFLASHARVLLCIAHDPGDRLRDTAASPGITERSAHSIITDLTTAGYTVKQKDGRRKPLPDPGPHALAGASQPGTWHWRSLRSPRRHATRLSPHNAGE